VKNVCESIQKETCCQPIKDSSSNGWKTRKGVKQSRRFQSVSVQGTVHSQRVQRPASTGTLNHS